MSSTFLLTRSRALASIVRGSGVLRSYVRVSTVTRGGSRRRGCGRRTVGFLPRDAAAVWGRSAPIAPAASPCAAGDLGASRVIGVVVTGAVLAMAVVPIKEAPITGRCRTRGRPGTA